MEVFIALLRALEYAHSNGVIHRDIKPANVMVGKYGETVEHGFLDLLKTHQVQAGVPAELVHFINKGISKNPADRWQSAGEMIQALQDMREGKVKIQCHATFTKRVARELGRFVDRHPHAAFFGLISTVVFGSAAVAGAILHWVV